MAAALRPRLLVTFQIPSHFIRSLEHVFDLDYQDTPTPLSREYFLSRIRSHPPDAMLFAGRIKVDNELLSAAGGKLKMLATVSVGYDHIDIGECRKRGVRIGYTPGW